MVLSITQIAVQSVCRLRYFFGLIGALLIATASVSAQSALNFDGTNDYVSTTYPGISGNTERTVEAWIRTTANCVPNNGGRQQIITDWGSMSTGGRSTFCVLWSNSIRFEVGGSGLSGSTPVNDGQWHHLAMTYKPGVPNPIKLYIDGQLDVEGSITTPVNTLLSTNLQVGMRVDGINHFTGDIDEVRVWDYARSAAQIQADRNTEFCQTPPGLIAYYKMNAGTPAGNNTGLTSVANSASANYNGTLQNFGLNGPNSNWVSGANLGTGGSSSNLVITTCEAYVSPSGLLLDSTGIYEDIIPNAAGCDSVITIDLTLPQINSQVIVNGSNTLTAVQSGAAYQWFQCGAAYTPIAGATSQTYAPSQNGDFAVEITNGACVDTSDCYAISTIGLSETEAARAIQIFPNPTHDFLQIRAVGEASVEVRDPRGRSCFRGARADGVFTLSTDSWPAGIYCVTCRGDWGIATRTFIKQ